MEKVELSRELASEREEIRKMLIHKGIVRRTDSFEPLWARSTFLLSFMAY